MPFIFSVVLSFLSCAESATKRHWRMVSLVKTPTQLTDIWVVFVSYTLLWEKSQVLFAKRGDSFITCANRVVRFAWTFPDLEQARSEFLVSQTTTLYTMMLTSCVPTQGGHNVQSCLNDTRHGHKGERADCHWPNSEWKTISTWARHSSGVHIFKSALQVTPLMFPDNEWTLLSWIVWTDKHSFLARHYLPTPHGTKVVQKGFSMNSPLWAELQRAMDFHLRDKQNNASGKQSSHMVSAKHNRNWTKK